MADELDDLEALAAGYVLGTLDDAAWRDVQARLARDPAFAALVAEWTRRLAPLSEAIPPVDPPPQVWQRIEAALPKPQPAVQVTQRPSPAPSLWERVAFWRWCTLAASAAAAALALYIAAIPPAPLPETRYVATLTAGEASPAWLVTVDIAQQRLTIRPLEELTVADKSYELWVVAGPDTKPRSLGLLSPEREIAIPIAAELQQAVPAAAALAVSLEPAGGSPTGLPTGPVLYSGRLLSITE